MYSVLRARREWDPVIKSRILTEMAAAGANVSAISRRHGVAQSLLYRWRKDAVIASVNACAFVPVVIDAPEPAVSPVPVTAPDCGCRCHASTAMPVLTVEVVLGPRRVVRVREGIDAADLKRIVAALEAS